MDRLKEYKIPFIGLKEGIHEFDFQLGPEFFEEFEFSDFDRGIVDIHVILDKKSNMLVLDFELHGNVEMICDRCGNDVTVDIEDEEKLIVKFGDKTGSTDEEILVLGPNEHEIKLSQYFFEFIELALPAKRVHEDINDCDQEVVKRLSSEDDTDDTDPRWDALKNLK